MVGNCGVIANAGGSSGPLPGLETSAACWFATTIICMSMKPFFTSPASSSRSDTYETASRTSNSRRGALDLPRSWRAVMAVGHDFVSGLHDGNLVVRESVGRSGWWVMFVAGWLWRTAPNAVVRVELDSFGNLFRSSPCFRFPQTKGRSGISGLAFVILRSASSRARLRRWLFG